MATNTDVQSFLESMGLTEKERELYLHSLRYGMQTASTISKKTGVARSTVNFIFDQLIQKGFATKEVRDKTTYFMVLPPETMEYAFLEKNAALKKQLDTYKEVLPLLKGFEGKTSLTPKVTYYQGLDSLLRTIDDVCNRDESVYFISSHNNMHPEIRDYVEKIYIPKSKKHVHKNKMILSDGPSARAYLKKADGIYDEVLLIDPSVNPFKITLAVHGDKVDFISYDPSDLSGIVIENSLIADHMRVVFGIVKEHFKK